MDSINARHATYGRRVTRGICQVIATIPAFTVAVGVTPAFAGSSGTALHAFTGGTAGDTPQFGTLVQDKAGALYGTTTGDNSTKNAAAGTVYQLTPAKGKKWKFTSIYKFPVTRGTYAGRPVGGLAIDASGNLYGATSFGLIFELSPPGAGSSKWTYQTIANLENDGITLIGSLLLSSSGTLFGVSSTSTEYQNGSIFQLVPPSGGQGTWTYQTLYGFQGGSDGAVPLAGVIADAKGNLYGTTSEGGTPNKGTVFELSPPGGGQTTWNESVIYTFQSGTGDGTQPLGSLLLGESGALFGTTPFGGSSNNGTVFELVPPGAGQTVWSETIIHSFTGLGFSGPYGGVISGANGDLYGSTSTGAVGTGGTVFRLTPPAAGKKKWQRKTLWGFPTQASGTFPEGNLLLSNGNLYGTTETGGLQVCKGATYCGTVFEVTP